MNKAILENGRVVIFCLCVLLFIYSMNLPGEREKYLEGKCAWTIAKTIDYDYDSGASIDYKYFVDGKLLYSASEFENLYDPLKRFYLIKYSIDKPEISKIYFNKEITDHDRILEAGYKVIDEKVINH